MVNKYLPRKYRATGQFQSQQSLKLLRTVNTHSSVGDTFGDCQYQAEENTTGSAELSELYYPPI